MRLTPILALTLLFGACLGSDFADSLDGSWQLTSGIVDGNPIAILDSHPITLVLDGDEVGGVASCNSYGGVFALSGSTITFGDLAMTEMACLPAETMEAEALYARALAAATTVTIDDGLTLEGPGVELVFVSVPSS